MADNRKVADRLGELADRLEGCAALSPEERERLEPEFRDLFKEYPGAARLILDREFALISERTGIDAAEIRAVWDEEIERGLAEQEEGE